MAPIKKNLVFVHGWGLSKKIWQPFYPHLQDDFQIHALDLPGFGEEKIERPMNLKDYAEFLVDFLEKNKIEQPIILGHSFGGAIAAKSAILYPENISKLILVDAAAIRKPTLIVKIMGDFAPFAKKIIPLQAKKVLLKILKLDKSDYATIDNPLLKKSFQKFIKENLEHELPKIKAPTLLIWGDKDLETPLSHGRLARQLIPTAEIIVLNGGHFIFFDHPQKFIKIIKEFGNGNNGQ